MGLNLTRNKQYEDNLQDLDTKIRKLQKSVRNNSIINAFTWGNKYFLSASAAVWFYCFLFMNIVKNTYLLATCVVLFLCKMRLFKIVKCRQKKTLDKLLRKKLEVLREVQEKVVYKKAKEIIDKFQNSLNLPEPFEQVILNKSQSKYRINNVFIKVCELLLGESTINRKELICSQCQYNCGQVHKEEYPFVAFDCAQCGFYNKPLVIRPAAPKL